MTDFGANSWLVDEMEERYRSDPSSVPEEWRSYFGGNGTAPVPPAAAPATPSPAPPAAPTRPAPPKAAPPPAGDAEPAPLRGAAARTATNMEASLGVPTATSFRQVPAKLLEVNRRVINGYLGRTGRGKVSFTHLIGFAVVRAIADTTPVMNSTYLEGPDGKPRVIRNPHVNLGLAVDL